MKIHELLEQRRDPDFDDDDTPEDPDQDRVPHIAMQVKKALDSEGRRPLEFRDGDRARLEHDELVQWARIYTGLKPQQKLQFQNQTAQSLDSFRSALEQDWHQAPPPRIRGNRYMSHFPGDLDQ
jgi:hypothetical protein